MTNVLFHSLLTSRMFVGSSTEPPKCHSIDSSRDGKKKTKDERQIKCLLTLVPDVFLKIFKMFKNGSL